MGGELGEGGTEKDRKKQGAAPRVPSYAVFLYAGGREDSKQNKTKNL